MEMEKNKRTRIYKCSRCSLHGQNEDMVNHRRFCPFIHCKCEKCKDFLDYRKALNRKRQLERHAKRENGGKGEICSDQFLLTTVDSQPLPQFLAHQLKSAIERQKREREVSLLDEPTSSSSSSQIDQPILDTTSPNSLNFILNKPQKEPSPQPTEPLIQEPIQLTSTQPTEPSNSSINLEPTQLFPLQPRNTFQLVSNFKEQNEKPSLTTPLSDQNFETVPQTPPLQSFNANFSNKQLRQMLLWQSLMIVQLFSSEMIE